MMSNIEVRDDIESFGLKLERFHGLFYSLWSMSWIDVTEDIATAGIMWDNTADQFVMKINPKFWQSLNEHTKAFILCHEMLHVTLRHPQRTKAQKLNPQIANIAQDVCINEMLVANFGFDRSQLNYKDQLCWLDTLPFPPHVQEDREFEYYYNLLIQNGQGQSQLADDHSGWGSLCDDSDKASQEVMEEVIGNLSETEIKDLINRIGGKEAGTSSDFVKVLKAKINKSKCDKWRKLFKHWTERIEDDRENWTRENRRLTTLRDSKFMLPADHEQESKKEKATIYLFLDTSGSCANLVQDFYDSFNSIPTKHFNVKLFGFTTKVYPIVNNKLRDFGGTSFSCIEQFLSQEKQYPTAVFVFTDGYGTRITPKNASCWYWFISKNGSNEYIPKESHKFWIDSLTPIS